MTGKTRRRSLLGAAEETLRAELAHGPRPTKEVKDAARIAIPAETWRTARVRVGAVAFRVGGRWYWSLPRDDIDAEFAAWLSTSDGGFAVYLAERDGLGSTVREDAPGQLCFDVDLAP
jgi:hypothetical protein